MDKLVVIWLLCELGLFEEDNKFVEIYFYEFDFYN